MLFHVEGYGALIERVRKLALLPDLPADVGEVTGGLLAYDLACREQGTVAGEFLGLLDSHAGQRRELEEAAEAQGCTVAGLEDYPDWRDTAGRLLSNGEALIEDLGKQAGDAGRRIRERLDRFTAVLALDDAIDRFETLRREVRERAEAAGTIPFYADGHDGLLEQARALVLSADLPAHGTGRGRRRHCRCRHLRGAACEDRCVPRRRGSASVGASEAGETRRRRAPGEAGRPCRLVEAVQRGRRAVARHARRYRHMEAPSGPPRR